MSIATALPRRRQPIIPLTRVVVVGVGLVMSLLCRRVAAQLPEVSGSVSYAAEVGTLSANEIQAFQFSIDDHTVRVAGSRASLRVFGAKSRYLRFGLDAYSSESFLPSKLGRDSEADRAAIQALSLIIGLPGKYVPAIKISREEYRATGRPRCDVCVIENGTFVPVGSRFPLRNTLDVMMLLWDLEAARGGKAFDAWEGRGELYGVGFLRMAHVGVAENSDYPLSYPAEARKNIDSQGVIITSQFRFGTREIRPGLRAYVTAHATVGITGKGGVQRTGYEVGLRRAHWPRDLQVYVGGYFWPIVHWGSPGFRIAETDYGYAVGARITQKW